MSSIDLSAAVRRVGVATALALSIGNIPAQAASITIDGNLTDLISQVGSQVLNVGSGSDPMGSADSPQTESNNGFDIKNFYSYYDQYADVLYLGMNMWGKVGDSRAITDTTSTNEYSAFCATTYCNRNIFDTNETYGIQLYRGTTAVDMTFANQLLSFSVIGANNGTDTMNMASNAWSLTVNRAISETNNGVEFSIAGLYSSGALANFPSDLLIRYSAGSADINPVSSAGAEDASLLAMQAVPVPAAVWLFASGLLGLGAVARKHKKKS